ASNQAKGQKMGGGYSYNRRNQIPLFGPSQPPRFGTGIYPSYRMGPGFGSIAPRYHRRLGYGVGHHHHHVGHYGIW
ncbi:unnamed protein product, partial [Adineta steineri]